MRFNFHWYDQTLCCFLNLLHMDVLFYTGKLIAIPLPCKNPIAATRQHQLSSVQSIFKEQHVKFSRKNVSGKPGL